MGKGGKIAKASAPAAASSRPQRTASRVEPAMIPETSGTAPPMASFATFSTSSCSSRSSAGPSLASMFIAIAVGFCAAIHFM